MKKILFVMTTLCNGGAERSLVNLLKEMPENRYQIDLLLFQKRGLFLKELPANVRLLDTPEDLDMMFGMRRPTWNRRLLRYTAEVVSRLFTSYPHEKRGFRWKYFYSRSIRPLPGQYDIAVAYIAGETMYYIDEKVQAARKLAWIHNDYRSLHYPKKYDAPCFRRMDAVVSVSDSCVEILKQEFPEAANKIYMLENITSSKVVNSRAEDFWPPEFQDNKVILLSVGRLNRQKGFDLAVDAAACMNVRGISFQWFVLGVGQEEDALKKQIARRGLEQKFHLLGSRENPYPYIKNCTMLVQTSRFEGKSVVLDEAKILHKPMVVTRYPTVSDQILDGREGLIAEMTPEGIAEKIEMLLNSPELYRKMENWLSSHEYGNQEEVKKYMALFEGEPGR